MGALPVLSCRVSTEACFPQVNEDVLELFLAVLSPWTWEAISSHLSTSPRPMAAPKTMLRPSAAGEARAAERPVLRGRDSRHRHACAGLTLRSLASGADH